MKKKELNIMKKKKPPPPTIKDIVYVDFRGIII